MSRQFVAVRFVLEKGVLCFGQMLFIFSVLMDQAFGTNIFGSDLYVKLVVSLLSGAAWGWGMWIVFQKPSLSKDGY